MLSSGELADAADRPETPETPMEVERTKSEKSSRRRNAKGNIIRRSVAMLPPIEPQRVERLFRGCKFFANLGPSVLQQLPEVVEHIFYPKGTVLFRQGDPAKNCYGIVSGELGVFIRKDLQEAEAARAKERRVSRDAGVATNAPFVTAVPTDILPPVERMSSPMSDAGNSPAHGGSPSPPISPKLSTRQSSAAAADGGLSPLSSPKMAKRTTSASDMLGDASPILSPRPARRAVLASGDWSPTSSPKVSRSRTTMGSNDPAPGAIGSSFSGDVMPDAMVPTRSLPVLSSFGAEGQPGDDEVSRYRAPLKFGKEVNMYTAEGYSLYNNATFLGKHVNTHGEGEVVGELALITDNPRAASCKCLQDTELLVLPKVIFDTAIKVEIQGTREEKLDFLAKHLPGFRDLPPPRPGTRLFAPDFFNQVTVQKGHSFVKQGEPAEDMIGVVFKGSVEVLREEPPQLLASEEQSAQEGFRANRPMSAGRSSSMERRPRSAGRATSASRGAARNGEIRRRMGTLLPGGVFGSLPLDSAEPFSVVAASSPCEVFLVSDDISRLPRQLVEVLRREVAQATARRLGLLHSSRVAQLTQAAMYKRQGRLWSESDKGVALLLSGKLHPPPSLHRELSFPGLPQPQNLNIALAVEHMFAVEGGGMAAAGGGGGPYAVGAGSKAGVIPAKAAGGGAKSAAAGGAGESNACRLSSSAAALRGSSISIGRPLRSKPIGGLQLTRSRTTALGSCPPARRLAAARGTRPATAPQPTVRVGQ